MESNFTLDQLCGLVDLSKRTVRYYMQLGLVDRPIGETRAAYYTEQHTRQLLKVKELANSGVSLERIREVLSGKEPPVAPRARQTGSIRVLSQVYIAPGIELQIDPDLAGLTPETLREFIQSTLQQWEKINGTV